MSMKVLSWRGPKGGEIGVGFDDKYFSRKEMQTEIDLMDQAHPNLPDDVPPGTSFVFIKESTGHLMARFRMGDTVYRNVAEEGSLHRLWDSVHFIEQLLHPARYNKIVS